MKHDISHPGVITHIGEEWSTADIVDESEQPVERTGVLTSMLPRGAGVRDRITLHGTVSVDLVRVEERK